MNEFSSHNMPSSQMTISISLLLKIQNQYRMCGKIQMQGCPSILALGHRVQQIKIKESQRRVDPEGCVLRRLHVINRRQCRVPSIHCGTEGSHN